MSDQTDTALQAALAADLREMTADLPDAPAPERIATLRALVESRAAAPRPTGTEAPQVSADAVVIPLRRTSRWAGLAVAASVGLLGFVGGVVVAQSPTGPLQEVAAAVGLGPSAAARATTAAVDDLGRALDAATVARVEGDLDEALLAAIADADAAMLASIREVDEDELADVRPVAHQVHLRAVDFFEDNGERLPTAQPADLEELYG